MTTQAFIIPTHATTDEIEAVRPPGAGDRRWTGNRGAGRWVTASVARLLKLVESFVNPLVYDFWQSHPFHGEFINDADDDDDAEFRTRVVAGVREYAAEMDLDVEAAEAEARRLLEILL